MAEDTRQDKRASFSSITEHNTNGMARTSAMASGKTGASKKLVIKNFKGIVTNRFHVCYPAAAPSHFGFTTSELYEFKLPSNLTAVTTSGHFISM